MKLTIDESIFWWIHLDTILRKELEPQKISEIKYMQNVDIKHISNVFN